MGGDEGSTGVEHEAVKVIAYSGYCGEEEPRAIEVDGKRYDVLGIDDRWYDPDARYFKVAAADGCVYLLRCASEDLSWSVVRVWLLDA